MQRGQGGAAQQQGAALHMRSQLLYEFAAPSMHRRRCINVMARMESKP
jgi:hypothetical protein